MNLLVKEARRLQNYAGGEWRNGTGQEMVLLHAALGHAHAVLESGADELPRAVDWARSTGGPALRALSFHRRAKMVQALAKHLAQQQEALVQECFAAGATLRDIRLDCRGGLAGMQALAARAARLLPDQQVLCEGEASFDPADQTAQQGILSSCGGVAVHVTSYDFPVRGVLKRLAPALMAGVPSILRPASDTAFVAEALVRLIAQSGLLPEGAVQLVYAGVDTIPDALAAGDILTCTGSRAQVAFLRRHPKTALGEIRLQTEEDGLSAAILGPDVTPDSPAMAQFLQENFLTPAVVARQPLPSIGSKRCQREPHSNNN